jgi:hypothetical protein
MEIDYTKSICGKCIHKKDVQGMGTKDLLGRSAALVFEGAFCKKANCWIPEIKDGDGNVVSDVSECDGFKKKLKIMINMDDSDNRENFKLLLEKEPMFREGVFKWMKDKGLLKNSKK